MLDERMAFVPEGRCDRSLARSAWDSATQKSRPVEYGLIRAGLRTDSTIGVTKFEYAAHFFDEKYLRVSCARSYRTLRDDSLGRGCPRHFVPGYYHAVPPGTRYILRSDALFKLALMGLKAWVEPYYPFGTKSQPKNSPYLHAIRDWYLSPPLWANRREFTGASSGPALTPGSIRRVRR